jgi:hypothetical protein
MKILTILLILLPILYSCKDQKEKKDLTELSTIKDDNNNVNKTIKKDDFFIQDTDFLKFTNNFQSKELPFEINYKANNWFDFGSELDMKEISQDKALKFLFNGDKAGITQKNGGYRQFYFGYKIRYPNDNIGLIYYMTDDEYVGFNLTLLSQKGYYLGNLFLAGSKGEYDIESQKDFEVDKNGTITINEIELNNNLATLKIYKFDLDLKKTLLNKKEKIVFKIDDETERINY